MLTSAGMYDAVAATATAAVGVGSSMLHDDQLLPVLVALVD